MLSLGKHVQVFDGFCSIFVRERPMHSIVRLDEEAIRERSTGDTNPDVVIVLG
jgi:hypothetical protein